MPPIDIAITQHSELSGETKPNLLRLTIYFIFSWIFASICSSAVSIVAIVSVNTRSFSLFSFILWPILSALYNGPGAFLLGTLLGKSVKPRTAVTIYLVPAFLIQGMIFLSAIFSQLIQHEVLNSIGQYVVLPIIDLAVAAYCSLQCFTVGAEKGKDFNKTNSALDISWYHWFWILPLALFQTIAVPLYLLLSLWKLDLLKPLDNGLTDIIFHFPDFILRIGLFGVLYGIMGAIAGAYDALTETSGSIIARSMKVLGTWVLVTGIIVFAAINSYSYVLQMDHESESLNKQIELCLNRNKYDEAEPLSQKYLAIQEKRREPTDPDLADDLERMAVIYSKTGKYNQAESLYKRAISLDNNFNRKEAATDLNNLAKLTSKVGKIETAKQMQNIADKLQTNTLGNDAKRRLSEYANLLRQLKRVDEANNLESQIKGAVFK